MYKAAPTDQILKNICRSAPPHQTGCQALQVRNGTERLQEQRRQTSWSASCCHRNINLLKG